MASPSALLGITYYTVIFTQVCSNPLWSQPDCSDQGQSGYWSGPNYEGQGPSYQQTWQAMVEETIRCVQQVIQVTKREMTLLLRQLATDPDCAPLQNIQAESYGDVTSGQIQFPPADSGYNYDRPQNQLQYPTQRQPSDPLIQPPIEPQVQMYYQPQVHQVMPQIQQQYLPDSQPVIDTDLYDVNCNRENSGQEVQPSTIENKISSSETYEASSVSSEHAYIKPQSHEASIAIENDNTSTTSVSIQVQPENDLVPPNSNISNTISNITTLTHSDFTTSTLVTNISHELMNDYNVTDSTPEDSSTQGLTSTEKANLDDEVDHENISVSSNNSSTDDLTTVHILIHGAPISLWNATSTTDRNYNAIQNYSENTLTIPSPNNNELDVNMENLPDKNKINYTNLLTVTNNVTASKIRPSEQTQSNNTATDTVTLTYNNSVESTEGNESMTLETSTNILMELSTLSTSTDVTATEATGESGSTLTIEKHDESPNLSTFNSTDATVVRRTSKV